MPEDDCWPERQTGDWLHVCGFQLEPRACGLFLLVPQREPCEIEFLSGNIGRARYYSWTDAPSRCSSCRRMDSLYALLKLCPQLGLWLIGGHESRSSTRFDMRAELINTRSERLPGRYDHKWRCYEPFCNSHHLFDVLLSFD